MQHFFKATKYNAFLGIYIYKEEVDSPLLRVRDVCVYTPPDIAAMVRVFTQRCWYKACRLEIDYLFFSFNYVQYFKQTVNRIVH